MIDNVRFAYILIIDADFDINIAYNKYPLVKSFTRFSVLVAAQQFIKIHATQNKDNL